MKPIGEHVRGLLYQALEALRDIPLGDYTVEERRTWAHHCIVDALYCLRGEDQLLDHIDFELDGPPADPPERPLEVAPSNPDDPACLKADLEEVLG